jgi:NTP pyrophosphatase (non-canonical NTP hydrolase)
MDTYQLKTGDTAAAGDDPILQLAVLGLGVAGEAGEVADYLKKVIGHGHELDVDVLAKELGDVLWYVARIADEVDLLLSDVATRNLQKLAARYPNGFSTQASINRL